MEQQRQSSISYRLFKKLILTSKTKMNWLKRRVHWRLMSITTLGWLLTIQKMIIASRKGREDLSRILNMIIVSQSIICLHRLIRGNWIRHSLLSLKGRVLLTFQDTMIIIIKMCWIKEGSSIKMLLMITQKMSRRSLSKM